MISRRIMFLEKINDYEKKDKDYDDKEKGVDYTGRCNRHCANLVHLCDRDPSY
jgi:hypothetical protein